MERLTKLCLKDLYILRDYLSANYIDFDKDWVLDQINIAIQKVTKIREINKEYHNDSEVFEDWI